MPGFRKQQRPGRDREQQAGERKRKRPSHCRAIERGGVCTLRQDGKQEGEERET
jgi:hypothetical protein